MKKKFETAQDDVKRLTERPSNDELLELYALYKQSTEGDNNVPKPSMFEMKELFKWNKWDEKKGMTKDDAMSAYVELVNNLLNKYSHN